jgi:hypothetical protein
VTGITRVLPRQANLFAFVIEKPRLRATCSPGCGRDGELRRSRGRRPPLRAAVEPRAPPGGLGPAGRGRRAVGGADRAGPQGRPLGRGRVLRHRRGRDRARGSTSPSLARPARGGARSTSAAASAGSPARSGRASSRRSGSTSRPGWSSSAHA